MTLGKHYAIFVEYFENIWKILNFFLICGQYLDNISMILTIFGQYFENVSTIFGRYLENILTIFQGYFNDTETAFRQSLVIHKTILGQYLNNL